MLALLGAAKAQPHYAEVNAPGSVLRVSFSGPLENARVDEFIAWLEAVSVNVASVYGRFPLPVVNVRIVAARRANRGGDSPVPFGRVTRRDGPAIELYVESDRPIEDFYADWTASHEFSHLLLPRISWRQRWISEGFASYYQNVLMARAGHYAPEEAIRKLVEGFARGRGSRPELSPNEATQEGIGRARYKIYWSGAAIALLADVRLRSRSGGSESLDVVLGRFQRCCLQTGRRWSGPELFRQFDRLVSEPVFMPLYRRYADQPGFPEVHEALADDAIIAAIFAVRTSPN